MYSAALRRRNWNDPPPYYLDVYGTYQVPVEQIETLTGMDFGGLKAYDPLVEREGGPYIVLDRLVRIVVSGSPRRVRRDRIVP